LPFPEGRYVFGKIHSAVFIHRAFINGSCAKGVTLELIDEKLLVVQQIEFVALSGADFYSGAFQCFGME